MTHAILGAGGVGGLVGAILAHAGERVTVLLRPETFSRHPEHIRLERPSGDNTAPVRRSVKLDEPVDILWVTVKALQLESALRTLPPGGAGIGTIVPLLNGIDHVAMLRSRYGHERVVPGTIGVEAERLAPGHIVVRSSFIRLTLAAQGEANLGGIAEIFRQAGVACEFHPNEQTMLWSKLSYLAPFALTGTASDKSIGEILSNAEWRARLESVIRETCNVAAAEGANLDAAKPMAILGTFPAAARSSMQKDVTAGRVPELDAIGGPIVRGGAKHHIDHSVTRELIETIERKLHPPN
ncbi:MAG: ketopantoate reductase family protein [Candidatus Acidiferrales bacterium]